jgi:hypothetical protein
MQVLEPYLSYCCCMPNQLANEQSLPMSDVKLVAIHPSIHPFTHHIWTTHPIIYDMNKRIKVT